MTLLSQRPALRGKKTGPRLRVSPEGQAEPGSLCSSSQVSPIQTVPKKKVAHIWVSSFSVKNVKKKSGSWPTIEAPRVQTCFWPVVLLAPLSLSASAFSQGSDTLQRQAAEWQHPRQDRSRGWKLVTGGFRVREVGWWPKRKMGRTHRPGTRSDGSEPREVMVVSGTVISRFPEMGEGCAGMVMKRMLKVSEGIGP